jgi:AraC-like DNA-binding protein
VLYLYNIDMDMLVAKLNITSAHRAYCQPGWSWDGRAMNSFDFNLWVVAGGEGTLEEADITYRLRRGDCFFLRGTESHLGRHNPRQPLYVPYVLFSLIGPDGESLWPTEEELPRYRRMKNIALLIDMVEHCVDAWQEGDHASAVHWLRSALLLAREADHEPERHGVTSHMVERVESLAARMRSNPSAHPSISYLAASAHCTRDHFIRVFRKIKGVTPGEFMIAARIAEAQSLLRFSNYTIGQIADQLGYSSPYFFSKQFKQRTGQTPSAYRALGLA